MSGKTWSPQEIELAQALVLDGSDDSVTQRLLGRTRQACRDKIRRIAAENQELTFRVDVPPEVIEERNRRLMAPRDLTGVFCGDPPVGFSALERRA